MKNFNAIKLLVALCVVSGFGHLSGALPGMKETSSEKRARLMREQAGKEASDVEKLEAERKQKEEDAAKKIKEDEQERKQKETQTNVLQQGLSSDSAAKLKQKQLAQEAQQKRESRKNGDLPQIQFPQGEGQRQGPSAGAVKLKDAAEAHRDAQLGLLESLDVRDVRAGAISAKQASQAAEQKEKAATDDLMERALARDRDVLRSEITDRPMEPRAAQETIARSAVKAAPTESGWLSAKPTGERSQGGQMIGVQRVMGSDAEKIAGAKAVAAGQATESIHSEKGLFAKSTYTRDPATGKLIKEDTSLRDRTKVGIGAGVAAAGAGIAALGLGLGLGLGLKDQEASGGAQGGAAGTGGTTAVGTGQAATGGSTSTGTDATPGAGLSVNGSVAGGVRPGAPGVVQAPGDVAAMQSTAAGVVVPAATGTASNEFESGRFEFARAN